MGFMSQRFAQELLVDPYDLSVFVGFSDLHGHILGIDRFGSLLPYFLISGNGLSTTSQASTRTGHHLNEMDIDLTALHTIHKLPYVDQSVSHRTL